MSLHPFRQGAPGRLCMEGKGENHCHQHQRRQAGQSQLLFLLLGQSASPAAGRSFFSVKGDTCSFFFR